MAASRPSTLGASRVCPHCKATVLQSAAKCPSCQHHLRFNTVGDTEPQTQAIDTSMPFKEAKERWNDHFERRYVATVFASNASNVTRAAEHAGLSRRHFRELLYKHGIVERPADDSDGD